MVIYFAASFSDECQLRPSLEPQLKDVRQWVGLQAEFDCLGRLPGYGACDFTYNLALALTPFVS